MAKKRGCPNGTTQIGKRCMPNVSKIVKRKKGKVLWEIWHEDHDVVQVMQYSSTKPMSRTIKRDVFERDWERVKRSRSFI